VKFDTSLAELPPPHSGIFYGHANRQFCLLEAEMLTFVVVTQPHTSILAEQQAAEPVDSSARESCLEITLIN